MLDIKACTVCLGTDIKLYNLDSSQLRQDYNKISGLQTYPGNQMLQYLCIECAAYVKRFMKFRDKCQRAHYTLQEILIRNKKITLMQLQTINRDLLKLQPSLSYINTSRVKYEEVKFTSRNDSMCINIHNNNTSIENEDVKLEDIVHDTTKSMTHNNHKESDVQGLEENAKEHKKIIESLHECNDSEIFCDAPNISDHEHEEPYKNLSEKNQTRNNLGYKDEEYAKIVPLTDKESLAVMEILKSYNVSTLRFQCNVCNMGFEREQALAVHSQTHEAVSGSFQCNLCNLYFKTEGLLKNHHADKHMYKYECKKCNEVRFDRASAENHYAITHLGRGRKNGTYSQRKLNTRGSVRIKDTTLKKQPKKKKQKPYVPVKKKPLPPDFPVCTSIRHEEQYAIVLERKTTTNYLDAKFKCDLCCRGFTIAITYNKHMKKHDPVYAGKYQCDVCKLNFKNSHKVYRHMVGSHIYKFSCRNCEFLCYNKCQAKLHYRWHKNEIYKCPHCELEFKKISTQLSHIRLKHPSTNICNICGHSFVSKNGLFFHKRITHSSEEQEKTSVVNPSDPLYCKECDIQFLNDAAFTTHLGSSNKHATTNFSASLSANQCKRNQDNMDAPRRPRRDYSDVLNKGVVTATNCYLCGEQLTSDKHTTRHFAEHHPGAETPKRYMCDVCGHVSRQYANLLTHMRTHTKEKPFECPHCEKRFSMSSNRDRHLVIHTGEKRYQCHVCNMRFTQSTAMKLHIQGVHLKIPYKPRTKRRRKAEIPATNEVTNMQKRSEPHGYFQNAFISYSDE